MIKYFNKKGFIVNKAFFIEPLIHEFQKLIHLLKEGYLLLFFLIIVVFFPVFL